MENKGRKFVIDLHTQMVGEEALTSDSETEDDERQRMEPDDGGVLRLEGGSIDDDLDSVNGLLHWQMEDYELFPSCNMLGIGEEEGRNEFPKEYSELKEGEAQVDETPAPAFSKDELTTYEEPMGKPMNLGDKGEKEEKNECLKEYKEAEEGKVVTAEAEGKSIQCKLRKKKDPTIRHTVNGPHRKKRMYRTIKLVEGCRKQGNNLDVRQPQAQWVTEVTQNRRKAWYDKHLKLRFQSRQLVLKYDGWNEIKPGKFRWVEPYQIREVGNNGAIKLWTFDGQECNAINGSKWKIYRARKTLSLSQNGQMTLSSLQNGDVWKQN